MTPVLPEDTKTLFEAVQAFERKLIAEALEQAGGKVMAAARLLGISHEALLYILSKRQTGLRDAPRRRRSIITK